MAKKVFITAATGHIAAYAIPNLIENNVQVKAFVHDASKAENLKKAGVDIIEGNFSEEEKLSKAMQDIEIVLSITPAGPDAFSNAANITRAAKNNKVKHLIRISAIKAAEDAPTDNGKLHFKTDSDIIESGIPYTILRPNFYMQNLLMMVPVIKEQSKIFYGMGDGKISMIDVRDIADCCVSIISGGDHQNKIYDPNGPSSISFYEIADIISERLKRTITYIPVSPEEVGESIRKRGGNEWAVKVMTDYARAYSNGWGDISNNDVEIITGHKPRSFRRFFDEVMTEAFQ
jgi:uncharacterized protein YbjT (DUF2867 family)